MSGRRTRTQARRKGGGGLPAWALLVAGLVLGAGAFWAWTSLSGDDSGFLRPTPDPDARPAEGAGDEEAIAPGGPGTQFDFYTLLPGDGEAMSDEELAASARAEAEAGAGAAPGVQEPSATPDPVDADAAPSATPAPADGVAAAPSVPDDAARYVLQAGAFAERGDAEAVKARIALLGLGARVESATAADGRVVHRVRLGPYASAAELAEAKRKLAAGGLPSLAIRAQ